MGLLIPRQGQSRNGQIGLTVANAEFGQVVTGSSTTHTKGSITELVSATTYDAFGLYVQLGATAPGASQNARVLVDIMIGGAGSEQALIPNLLAGNLGSSATSAIGNQGYYFPIFIPAGSRIAARCQGSISSETVNVSLQFLQWPIPGQWYGTRVTAYGADTANSRGTSHTPGAGGSYAAATQLTASTTNRIRALQIGIDMLSDTTASDARGLAQILAGSSSNTLVSGLPWRTSTTFEQVEFSLANFILSHMRFDIPAGSYLGVGAQLSVSEARGFALYGVD